MIDYPFGRKPPSPFPQAATSQPSANGGSRDGLRASGLKRRSALAHENPFAVHRIEGLRYRFSRGEWEEHLLRLKRMRYRAAIVGPLGSGKTTLLDELARRLRDLNVPIVRERAFPQALENRALIRRLLACSLEQKIILLDSAERLPMSAWIRLIAATRRRTGLIVTAHRPCWLPTWIECRTSWETAAELLAELGFSDGASEIVSAARRAYRRHHGNIREVFRALYDECARTPQSGAGIPCAD